MKTKKIEIKGSQLGQIRAARSYDPLEWPHDPYCFVCFIYFLIFFYIYFRIFNVIRIIMLRMFNLSHWLVFNCQNLELFKFQIMLIRVVPFSYIKPYKPLFKGQLLINKIWSFSSSLF